MGNWDLLETCKDDSMMEKEAKNFRVRLLGIFYEKIIKPWFLENDFFVWYGRPSCYRKEKWTNWVFDYVIEKGQMAYIVEAKCYPAYMEGSWQQLNCQLVPKVERNLKGAFKAFRSHNFLREYNFKASRMEGKPQQIVGNIGKILIWWDFSRGDYSRICNRWGLNDLLSIKSILNDLKREAPGEYVKELRKYKRYSRGLFELLNSKI